ncbi:hypothetical protein [Commensalibacter oyaizuii]|uniref:Uncharacterized protein n=1 Tax=Commensalibacter oyaizuii TaxID=3043873 RepID=A0ABT6Q2K0_9PROT|nr:hypothetical protein [Commensalibacter sp. TBRC 16381]MDI2090791.1 hypothetical protein [Commensalibacter sp. TBRC 16381]
MIMIQGEDAIIQIDVKDISNDLGGVVSYDYYIDCELLYKRENVFFVSKDIRIFYLQLKSLYLGLKDLVSNTVDAYYLESERNIISIGFFKDQYSSDFLLNFHFYLEWESETSLKSKMRISTEQIRDFANEIRHLVLNFENNI